MAWPFAEDRHPPATGLDGAEDRHPPATVSAVTSFRDDADRFPVPLCLCVDCSLIPACPPPHRLPLSSQGTLGKSVGSDWDVNGRRHRGALLIVGNNTGDVKGILGKSINKQGRQKLFIY